ncbi:16S rRNA (cytidine(1402)-2'-O)-methyltransferase [Candidatus Uhrbacteria bacterium RIFCSPHIGHO2_12_FULL_60_25]|uniref:Ribosomal RNA small subunit methyltransferase I n=1 Tax=Candidatus Uhrbacteria bacterium RIFCSPHIGHO2_12_FULL_60_25 TaxID=1802399 RepID=A0A1F7ULV8_9BACT|nr:MAG: 16S rRNA (cytidine(1402)-2'-O)-methyltransferase [Candidatus Uhrbacteria bacterium RIFCSPHIGHO2_12_FULL_60_25]
MPGRLSMVATPIGNLEDVTFRAVRTLSEADVVACEDTRVSAKLLAAYKIPHKPLVSLHHHSSDAKLKGLIDSILAGQHVAYVSDAGTPGVNDPGGKLVQAAYAAGVSVETIPGPSALTAAIAVCGFPMERFAYLGFLPRKKGRDTLLRAVSKRDEPSVFFESTHRIKKTMEELTRHLDPSRIIYVGRELTKKFETNLRGTIHEVKALTESKSMKGEFVIIIGPAV